MGIFDKLFGSSKERSTAVLEKPPCPHTALVPRWDNIEDIGHEDRATSYVCEACHESFSPEEASRFRKSVTERLVGPGPGVN